MRARLAVLLTGLALISAVAGLTPAPAEAQAVSSQAFAAYGSGATTSVNVLGLGDTQVLNVQTASAGQSANSQGLPSSGITNELGYIIQPAGLQGQNAYGRATGLEIGALTPVPNPDPNQILLAGLAQQAAPPIEPAADVETIGPIAIGGIAFANLLQGKARAIFDPNTCVIGRPISYGEGSAAGVQLLGTTTGANLPFTNPLIGTQQPNINDPNQTSRTRALTYLRPNGDGTFAVVSEVRQHIAPIAIAPTVLGGIYLELLGEWATRAVATGKPNGASIEYAPVGAGPETTVARLTIGASAPIDIAFQDILGPNGLDLEQFLGPLALLINATIGTPPRAIGGGTQSDPLLAADGTSASGAVDVARVTVLNIPDVLSGADIRLGHMEVAAVAPAGGVECNVPVSKVGTPDPVQAGQDFTITITIPSDTELFRTLFGCDLLNIRVEDVHEVESGDPSFRITGASNDGRISSDGRSVVWDNIGNYSIGDPPIVLTVTGTIPGNTAAGVLRDTATVTATLGNCDGGAGDVTGVDVTGVDIVGQGISGGAVRGVFTLRGPNVGRGGVLAATGGDERLLLLGGVFLLGAIAVRRRMRRPAPTTTG